MHARVLGREARLHIRVHVAQCLVSRDYELFKNMSIVFVNNQTQDQFLSILNDPERLT